MMRQMNQLMKVLNGKKTLLAQVVAIVSAVWMLVSPDSAPKPEELEAIVQQGQTIFAHTREELIPMVTLLVASVTGFFTNLHSQNKTNRAVKTVGLLVAKPVEIEDIQEPEEFVKSVQGKPQIQAVSGIKSETI